MTATETLNHPCLGAYAKQTEKDPGPYSVRVWFATENQTPSFIEKSDYGIPSHYPTLEDALEGCRQAVNLGFGDLTQGFDRSELHVFHTCLLYTSPSPRDLSTSRMPSSA